MNDPAAFDAAVADSAAFVGFVFYPASPRHVTAAQAAELSSRHSGGPRRVGLFVEPEDDAIAAALAAIRLDVLQIYAPAARAAAIRQQFGIPVWHAVGIAAAADLPHQAPGVDALLVDAKAPPDATRPGGNAAAFDWSLLSNWAAPRPWVLAGGLTPDNVAEAIRIARPPAVDVSSGVEQAPGVKDPALIGGFIAATRAA